MPKLPNWFWLVLFAFLLVFVPLSLGNYDPVADYLRIHLGSGIRWFWLIGLIVLCILVWLRFRKRKGP